MKAETENTYHERLLRVLIRIQNSLDETILLDDLASEANMSPFHFHRIFKGMVGETVMGYVRRLRLERAAYMLKISDQRVTRIAFDAGYETHEAFTRAFSAMFGASPSMFRKKHRYINFAQSSSGVHFSPDGIVEGFPMTTKKSALEVQIKNMEPVRVAFVRHVGPYDQCGIAWGKLCGWAGPRGLLGPDAEFIGASYDDPQTTPEGKIRYDACVRVGDAVEAEGEIGIQVLSGGPYAVVRHLGPYSNFEKTYSELCGIWLPASGREVRSAPSLEYYRNSPDTTPEDELITDIFVPLED